MSKADSNENRNQLNGLKVLVTRPLEQSVSLVSAIESQGGIAHSFPLLEIQPVSPCPDNLSQLDEYDLIIFVSRNAVKYIQPCLAEAFPVSLKVAAVGKATAASLEQYGQGVDITPASQFDSEGLLATAELMNVADQRILIVRGRGGREQLAETLRARGAHVDYAEVYQRIPTEQVLTYRDNDIDAIIITSSEALLNLQQIAGRPGKAWLLEKQLVMLHERIAVRANELGFKLTPVVAKQASEAALIDALHSISS